MAARFRRQPDSRRTPFAPLAVLTAIGIATVGAPAHATTGTGTSPSPKTGSKANQAANQADKQAGSLTASAQAATAVPTVAVLGAPARSGHTVRSGDTLSGIASARGVSVAALRQANALTGSVIHPGQRLTIPGTSAKTASDPGARGAGTTAAPAAGKAYTVRPGDTFSSIAARAGVSTADVQAINPGVAANALQVGQRISLPSSTRPVGSTFAGRTYPEATVDAANDNHAQLASRPKASRDSLQRKVSATAGKHGVDPSLAQAVARQESGFQQHVVSPANAVGVMQVTPSAGRWASQMVGRDLDLLDPDDNATAGVLVLKANLRAANTEDEAIAAYYQGLSSVRKNGMYDDTRTYVTNIQRLRAQFR